MGSRSAAAKEERRRPLTRAELVADFLVHLGLVVGSAVVLVPNLWIVSRALDPRNISQPTSLRLIPEGGSLGAFDRVLTEPLAHSVMVSTMLKNSLIVSARVALSVVVLAVSAAYAFSRLQSPGRTWGLFPFIGVLMPPQVATLAPLFVLLSRIKPFGMVESIRTTLAGVGVAYISGAPPFATWNLRGYIDTIPREVEEAALIDGARSNWAFVDVAFPLILPAIAITVLFGFMASWTECILAWTFLTAPSRFALAMGLSSMVGQCSSNTPWSEFAAMAILITLPIGVLFFQLQRWIVSGLVVGGVKG